MAAVIADGLKGALGGKAGGDGGHQHQNMLAGDHLAGIVPENDLGVGVVLRLQNVDGLVGVDGLKAALGQFLRKARAQHRGAVQAQNGIHRGIVDEVGHQLMGAVLGLAQTGLLVSDIHVVIDVGMIGGKMSPGDAKRRVAPADGQIHQCDHSSYLRLKIK